MEMEGIKKESKALRESSGVKVFQQSVRSEGHRENGHLEIYYTRCYFFIDTLFPFTAFVSNSGSIYHINWPNDVTTRNKLSKTAQIIESDVKRKNLRK